MYDRNPYFLPLVIIAAGAIVAGALYIVRSGAHEAPPAAAHPDLLAPPVPQDHIIGNPSADVTVVEFCDIDTDYCKEFQSTMEQIMSEYAPAGKVAWIYRHFPALDVHPNAGLHAKAAECAAKLGGENAFWRFIDVADQLAPAGNTLTPSRYADIAGTLGINADALTACAASNEFDKRVADEFQNAVAIGADGTPYSIILVKGSAPIPVSGALPYEAMKKIIQAAIAKVK